MEKSISESRISNNQDESSSSVSAKLRRLKIQEEILTASVNKTSSKDDIDVDYNRKNELRHYSSDIKKSFFEIKHLFQDIKIISNDREYLKNTDIDDVKKDILKLEQKITSLNEFLRSEITVLRVAERELMQKIHESPESMNLKIPKVLTKPLNDVVPSPVRTMIKSPLKCVEVQRFQDFMKNSKRYGGWDEYNHNVFVHTWNKYFKTAETPNIDDTKMETFKDELCKKIFGVNTDDINSHIQWYLQYVELKKCQEEALNKWKENKRKIKNPKRNTSETNIKQTNYYKNDTRYGIFGTKSVSEATNSVSDDISFSDKSMHSITFVDDDDVDIKTQGTQKRSISNLFKPTKQWENRCKPTLENISSSCANIDDIKKLRIPSWRLDMQL